jgi:hypothetical protein
LTSAIMTGLVSALACARLGMKASTELSWQGKTAMACMQDSKCTGSCTSGCTVYAQPDVISPLPFPSAQSRENPQPERNKPRPKSKGPTSSSSTLLLLTSFFLSLLQLNTIHPPCLAGSTLAGSLPVRASSFACSPTADHRQPLPGPMSRTYVSVSLRSTGSHPLISVALQGSRSHRRRPPHGQLRLHRVRVGKSGSVPMGMLKPS